MVKEILGQLENLAFRYQARWLKKIYPDLTGIKIGRGFLWQHPGGKRQAVLERFQEKVEGLDKLV